MGLTDYIRTRLLNNRVEQYNTKRSYWGEDERQPLLSLKSCVKTFTMSYLNIPNCLYKVKLNIIK